MQGAALAACLLIALPASAGMSKEVRRAALEAASKSRRARPEIVGDEISAIAEAQPTSISRPGACYIAVHFARLQLGTEDRLTVRAPQDSGRSWTYSTADAPQDAKGFWAAAIPGDRVLIALTNSSGTATYTVDRYAAGMQPERIINRNLPAAGMLQICGVDDSQEARCYADSGAAYQNSRAVARLLINGQFACTGWLVGPEGHLLTNEHCIQDAGDAQNVNVEFMAEGASCDADCNSWFACPGTLVATSARFITASRVHDYALVKLSPAVAQTYGYLRLRRSGPRAGESIYVPQHPRGAGKRLVVKSTEPEDQQTAPPGVAHINTTSAPACDGGANREVGYAADTDPGASGSPVIAATDDAVVALHHCGGCPNRGIPIDQIIKDLGRKLPPSATVP